MTADDLETDVCCFFVIVAVHTDGGNDFQTRSGRGKKCCKIIFAMILQHFL